MKSYTAADYRAMLAALLPRGLAWPRDPESVLGRLLAGLAQELARVDSAGHLLMDEADPELTVLLLPEWEAMCGLPDDCSQAYETLAERRAAVVLQLAARGGQSAAYYEDLARVYSPDGAEVAVTEFRPFRAGVSSAEDPACDEQWAHVWMVTAPSLMARSFAVGAATAGEPLRTWGNQRLECVITRLKPAHTRVIFAYTEV